MIHESAPNDPASSPETGLAVGTPPARSAPEHAEHESPREQRRHRMKEILHVLRDEHLMHLTGGADFSDYVPEDAIASGTAEKDLPEAIRARHALERLGPAWIEVGQLRSRRCTPLQTCARDAVLVRAPRTLQTQESTRRAV